jgi:hypothetical protein
MMGIVEFQQYDIWVWPENEAFTHHTNGNLRGENGQGGTLSSHRPIDWNSAEHQLTCLAGHAVVAELQTSQKQQLQAFNLVYTYFAQFYKIAHFDIAMEHRSFSHANQRTKLAVCQNLVPLVNIKIAAIYGCSSP